MTGVTITTTGTTTKAHGQQFESFEARCTCGWRMITSNPEQTNQVRSIGRDHDNVCVG